MTDQIGVIVIVLFGGGLIAGIIAYNRLQTAGAFVGYFIFGALLPLIGIICAAIAKRPYTAAPGWYPDPLGAAQSRWFDGTVWTDNLYLPRAG